MRRIGERRATALPFAEDVLTQPEDARRLYDRLSPAYDRLAESSEHGVRALGLQALPIDPGATVLELGCGTGHGLVRLAQAVGRTGTAIGLDVSSGMLAGARSNVAAAAGRRVPLVRGDATHLCFAPGVVDAVFMSFTLELFGARIPDVLSEIWRVLRPGGRVGIVAMATGHGAPMIHVYEWAHRHWPHLVDCEPIDAVGALSASGFVVEAVASASVWTLPIAVAVATRPARPRSATVRVRP